MTSSDPVTGKVTFAGHTTKSIIIKPVKPKDKDTIEFIALNYKGTIYIKDNKYKIMLSSLEYQYGYKSSPGVPDYALKHLTDWISVSPSKGGTIENSLCNELAKTLIIDIARKTNISSDSDF